MQVGSFKSFIDQKLGKFPHLLVCAIVEWVMIILLFSDGLLAFVSNELAKFFELRIPCLLCTRIDHVLVRRDSSFYYNDSICEIHKKDISSLAYCHMHKKLSDIHNMCQGCLLSFATGKDSDRDRYKSLVGNLQKDVDSFVVEEQKLLAKPVKIDDADVSGDTSDDPRCSCCGEPLKLKFPSKYTRSLSMNVPTQSPRASRLANKHEGGHNINLPHVKYKELKFSSDTESEFLEDDASNVDNQDRLHTNDAMVPLLHDSKDVSEGASRTPNFTGGNRFIGISHYSAQLSPRWVNKGIRKPLVDRLDSVVEPGGASSLNEADGDILNCLNRQLHLDHKSLMSLYMELEEERSAAAVAANNAMAMITRLQAEKATVQMEALQYQRMMEEQAEYDEEALQIMRDMVLKREEDRKALESELEAYREKYGHIKKVGNEICEVDVDDDYQGEKSDCDSLSVADQNETDVRPYEHPMEIGVGNQEELSLDFEEERSYLLGLLTVLEEKINAHEGSSSSNLGATKLEDGGTGNKNKVTLTRDVSLIKEQLRAIEADSGFLKHAAMTLHSGGEGMKLLAEIAQHLWMLRHSANSPSKNTDA